MQKLSRLLSYCLSKLWFFGIVMLIVVALGVSALRASLPYVNKYNHEISLFLLEHYQLDLYVAKIDGRWRDGGPELVVHNVQFNNLKQLGVDFSASSIRVHLDLRQSMLAFSPRLTILEINQPQLLLGQLPVSDQPNSDQIPRLFNTAQDIVINDATVMFDPKVYPTVGPLHIAEISWLNSQFKHQLQLSMAGPDQSSPLSLVADFYGETRDNLSGRFYVKAQDWQWLDDVKMLLPELNHSAAGNINFELWGDYSNSALDSMVVTLGDNQLSWSEHDQLNSLTIINADLQWLPYQSGWLMEARDIAIEANDHSWPTFSVTLSQQQLLNGKIDQLSLASLLELRGLFAALPNDTEQMLQQLQPQARLSDITFWHQQQWHYQLKLEKYRQQRAGGIPNIEQFDAVISGDQSSGQAQLMLGKQRLDFGKLLIKPIELTELSTTLKWQFGEQRWWLSGENLKLVTPDIEIQLDWQLAFETDVSPVLSLYGQARLLAAQQTKLYLPHQVISDGLINYLSAGIKGGSSNDIAILWQGELAGFPYRDHSGIFQVDALLTQVNFMFDRHWLPLTDATLKLQFENEAMDITGLAGRVKDLTFKQLRVEIPDLTDHPTLAVDLVISEKIAAIKPVIDKSPLKKSVGKTLDQLSVGGKVNAKIHIDLPLDGSLPLVTGEITLKNNQVDILPIAVTLNRLNGKLNFVNGTITSQNVTAKIYNQPVALTINTKPLGGDYGVEIDLNGKWHTTKMPHQWRQHLDDYLAGTLDWLGKITLKVTEGDLLYQANFKSPMTGLALKLPQPLNKYVDQKEALAVSVTGNIDGGQFNLELGSRAEALAKFDLTKGRLDIDNMALLVGRRFNSNDSVVPNDMSLQVDLATLQIDEWQTFINNLDQGQQGNRFFPPLRNINILVERLSLYGQVLTNVSLSGFKLQDYWKIGLLSDQAKGSIKLYHDLAANGIVANFEHFRLDQSESSSKSSFTQADLTSLPKLSFSCQQCQIGNYQLGQLSFSTEPAPQGVAIKELLLDGLSTSLQLSGLWGADEQGTFANIVGQLNSDNVVDTLQLLNFRSSIKDSDAKIGFDLSWRGDIYAPVIETIKGQVNWRLGEGHISDVSDQGARIFSLFSLDSLRRKLVLDFRDVFVKGLFYNSFDGSFEIDQGIAVTRDTKMDGIAGDLEVVGSINLVDTNLDYYISFTPRLISNIPVVAGVVASAPQVFILAFAITKVLEPIIDVVSQVNFKLTGDLTNPEFVEVNRKQMKYTVPIEMLPKSKVVEPTTKAGASE